MYVLGPVVAQRINDQIYLNSQGRFPRIGEKYWHACTTVRTLGLVLFLVLP